MRSARVAIAVVLGAGVLVPASFVRGQPDSPSEPAADTAWMNAQEAEAFKLLDKDKPVTARRLADKLVAEDPDSIIGHYVLGRILHEHEGDHGRAIYHLGHARELYEDRFPVSDPTNAPWKFHRDLLLSISSLAAEMEEYDYQIDMLKFHDELYRPARPGEQAWPLMKLGRIEEAIEVATKAKEMKDPGQRSLGLNTLCAIQRARDDRAAARAACVEAFDNAVVIDAQLPETDTEHRSSLAIHAYNAALAARADFAPQEAERLALLGAKRLAFTPANPWRFLVNLYIDSGRGGDAATAVREMHRWRVRQPPQVRAQDRAENDVTVAIVLLVAGRTGPALRLVDRAIEFPDRRGLESTAAWQTRAAHVLIRGAIRRADDEIIEEAAAITDADGRGILGGARERLRRLAEDEMLTGLLESDERLVDTFRLFGERGATGIPPWLLGDLVETIGPGVISVVLRMVREQEKVPALEPYWDSVEAEVHLARERYPEARAMAEKAMAALPENETLLRARSALTAARAAGELGDRRAKLALLDQAYQLDPSVLRRQGIALPAKFAGSGPDAEKIVGMLRRSPRFSSASDGFQVDVLSQQGMIRICLRSPEGNELRCIESIEEEPKQPTQPVQPPQPTAGSGSGSAAEPEKPEPLTPERAVEEFHRGAFSLPLNLTGTDMNSLDGSTTVSEQAVRERMDQVLDELTTPK
jgi:tetratricopeptide (TPR) repeat protein